MLSFIDLVFQRIKSSKFTPHNLINSPESIDIANHFERIEKNMGILSEIMILGLKMGKFFFDGVPNWIYSGGLLRDRRLRDSRPQNGLK